MNNSTLHQLGLKKQYINFIDIQYWHEKNRALENNNCFYLKTIVIRKKSGKFYKKVLK